MPLSFADSYNRRMTLGSSNVKITFLWLERVFTLLVLMKFFIFLEDIEKLKKFIRALWNKMINGYYNSIQHVHIFMILGEVISSKTPIFVWVGSISHAIMRHLKSVLMRHWIIFLRVQFHLILRVPCFGTIAPRLIELPKEIGIQA